MSKIQINKSDKDVYIKTLKLHAIINAIQDQEEVFQGRDGILREYQQENPAVYVLIDSLLEEIHFVEGIDFTKEDNFNMLLEVAGKKLSSFNKEKINGYFDISILPFLNWRWVVQSIRAQMIQDRMVEEMCFKNFLGYQNRSIEEFIRQRVK